MASCSVAEATARLPGLIERALKGEPVVITREGKPVIELKPVAEAAHATPSDNQPRRVIEMDLDWLRAHRVGRRTAAEDAGTLVSRMRDEDWR